MTLRRWEPFRDLMNLREAMDRMMEDSFFTRPGMAGSMAPVGGVPMDVYETGNEFVVKAWLPGWRPDDVDITLTGDTLTIKGEWKQEEERGPDGEASYYLKESRTGSFSRSLTIPTAVKTDEIDASFENGVLTLHIPKAEEARPRQIKVKARETLEAPKS